MKSPRPYGERRTSICQNREVFPDPSGCRHAGDGRLCTIKKLQEELVTEHIPVILITSLSDANSEEQGLILGAVDYIVKPFHPPIVRVRVNTHIKLYRYRSRIEQQAMVDEMTKVANRRYYDQQSVLKWQEAIRLKAPFSVCMFDIDKFKVYNDTYGHPAGDRVIEAVAQTASSSLRRSTDLFARYGGEEFIAIVLGGKSEEVFTHFKNIRQAIEDLHIEHSGKESGLHGSQSAWAASPCSRK